MDTVHGGTRILRRPVENPLLHRQQTEAVRVKEPLAIVIFGASGDLAHRKLIPALYRLHEGGFLPQAYAVIGFSRSPMSDEGRSLRENGCFVKGRARKGCSAGSCRNIR